MNKRARQAPWYSWLALGSILGQSACGADGAAYDAKFADSDGGAGGNPSGAPGPYDDAGAPSPEDELEAAALTFGPPAVGATHVWVPSSDNDLVLRIDAVTRKIEPVSVADAPNAVVTRPGREFGVALCPGSDELVLIDAETSPSEVRFVALPRHFNRVTLDPSGATAWLWFEFDDATAGEDTGALQDLGVVDLETQTVDLVTTGFRPQRPVFPGNGDVAYVVTDDGLGLVPLAANAGGERVGQLLATTEDPFLQAGREVYITPDGRYVVSRAPAEAALTILEPETETLRTVALAGTPTDLDLSFDGRVALVMLRDEQKVVRVDLATATTRTLTLPVPLGSAAMAADTGRALLYTTLPEAELSPRIAVLDLAAFAEDEAEDGGEAPLVQRPVRKEIAGATLSPDGRRAFLLHRRAPGRPDPALGEEEFLRRSPGWSLVDLGDAGTGPFVRLVTTQADPLGVFWLGLEDLAFVPLDSGAPGSTPDTPEVRVHRLQVVDLARASVRDLPLPSPPETIGALDALERLFITQTHPEGRISFLSLERSDAPLETLSGYLLNGGIE
jgi:hypothetical protein